MELKNTKSFLALIGTCMGAGLAACSGGNNTMDTGADVPVANDVQDSGGHDATDVQATDVQDVQATDVQDVQATDVQDVQSTDVQDVSTDAPACTATLPNMATLISLTQSVNSVSAWYLDADPVMFGNPGIFPFVLMNSITSSPPDAMDVTADSTCFYFSTFEGSTARQNSSVQDRGLLTMNQATFPLTAMYDSAMMKYVFDPSMATDPSTGLSLWVPGMSVTATLAGGADGSGGTSAALPLFTLIHQADFTIPNPISRTSDNTFTWNTPPDLPANQVAMAAIINNSDFSDGVWCFAPACQHHMTVSGNIMSHAAASMSRQVLLVFPQSSPIGTGTDAANFVLYDGVDIPGNTGP